MEGVSITRKLTSSNNSSTVEDALVVTLVVAIGLVLLPIALLVLVCLWVRDVILPAKVPASDTVEEWYTLEIRPTFALRYKTVYAADISDAAEGYFEDEPLVLYQTEPSVPFFEGYFTDFRVARADGVFVQKILFDAQLEDINAMPLYFFAYQTQEAEELIDLQDYELDTKGNPSNFLITALGEHDEVTIHAKA
ncbi:hypothetical protein MTX78_15855 [Hymenobacter tibetensis]|uniref:Uncharacterized protein n=1 Tax=Hymenobacter tibetensis TaxID=497967 RepID=A0ABY4CTK7_9BACT|nr:hypothetical protein [Hymenobacter tibetensis]UOG73594.1 hypothetical protein MTX78_15855 [Hymenobacter tibetensis]